MFQILILFINKMCCFGQIEEGKGLQKEYQQISKNQLNDLM